MIHTLKPSYGPFKTIKKEAKGGELGLVRGGKGGGDRFRHNYLVFSFCRIKIFIRFRRKKNLTVSKTTSYNLCVFVLIILLFRRRRGGGSTGRHSHRSRSSRRWGSLEKFKGTCIHGYITSSEDSNGTYVIIIFIYLSIFLYRTSSRHGSRRSSPTRSSRPLPGRRGRPVGAEEEAGRVQVGTWQHSLSFLFSCLSALLGMFSISRFSILTADFGG